MPQIRNAVPNYEYIESELERLEADAYVHIGDDQDNMLWYLTRFNGPDRDYAFVLTDEETTLCAPALFQKQAQREFPGDQVEGITNENRKSAARRAINVLDTSELTSRILVPETIPYRAYYELAESTYEIITTADVAGARGQKTPAEVEYIRETETVAQEAMQHAEAILANSTISDEELIWKCKPLTTERLRREINQTIASKGANDAGNTVIGAGPSCADLHYNGDDKIMPGETVLIDLGPRGTNGYYGDITRTFVPGDVPPWEKFVYDAVLKALESGLDHLNDAPGISGLDIHETIVDVIETFGFGTGNVDVGLYHGTGHGVGTSLHEPPFFSSETELKPGHVVTIEPGIYDPDRGGVRLEDLVLITEDGIENLVDLPYSIKPNN